MPISTAPHTAVLPWLVALAGTFAVHLALPDASPPYIGDHTCARSPVRAGDHAREARLTKVEHVIAKGDFDRLREEASQDATPSAEGLRLRCVRPGSLFGELGFESGDLVVAIEGGDATRFRVLRGAARRPIEIVLRIG